MSKLSRLALVAALLSAAACAHTMIEGTTIRDTPDHREVLDILAKMQKALEDRDPQALLSLVSTRYFEDMGTSNPDDDYGYVELRDHFLPASFASTDEFYITMQVHEVVVDGTEAHADVRYDSRARVVMPSGTLWDTHKEFNRIELSREDDTWRIVAGL